MSHVVGPLQPPAAAAAVTKDQIVLPDAGLNKPSDSQPDRDDGSGIKSENPILDSGFDLNATHLISSPYPDLANQLRLSDLSTEYQLFAHALTALKPIRPDYATAPYLDSFNWPEVFSLLRTLCGQAGCHWSETRFYVVIFRSKVKSNVDRDRLGLLDQKSHEEACASGGLLKYWFGTPDEEWKNLATCLWCNHDDAVKGGSGNWHKQAREAAGVMYEFINFHAHTLTVSEGAESWTLEEYR